MIQLRLVGGLLAVEAPDGSEVEYRSPRQEVVLLPDGREVHISPNVLRGGNGLFKPRVAIEHAVAKFGARVVPEGDFYQDVQVGDTGRGPGGREGRVFLRFDRYKSSTLRVVIFAPGRFVGESVADREHADAAARALAESARFSERATPLDLTAPDPGCPLVTVDDLFLFTLPPNWSAEPIELGEDEEAEDAREGKVRREMHCRSPNGRFELDVLVTAVDTDSEDREEPLWAATNHVIERCQSLFENGPFEEDTEVNPFLDIPHTTGVVHYASDRAAVSGFVRLHVFVGPERSIFAELDLRGPLRRQKAKDRKLLVEVDGLLANAQPWHPGLAEILKPKTMLNGAPNGSGRECNGTASPGQVIDIGLGMVRLPLRSDWRWTPDPPFGGDLIAPDGQTYEVTVQSYFDPLALKDRSRLEAYALDDDFEMDLPKDADPLANFMISVTGDVMKGKSRAEEPVLLKSLEPFGGTHIRELRVSTLVPDDKEPMEVFAGFPELLSKAEWSREATLLDGIAPSEEAKQESLEHWVFFRLPADWTFVPNDAENASADDLDGLETLWVTAALGEFPKSQIDRKDMEIVAERSIEKMLECNLDAVEWNWLSPSDVIVAVEGEDEDASGPLRRIQRLRITVSDRHVCFVKFVHVIDRDTRDEKRDWTERFFKDSLATAVIIPEAR